MPRKGKMSQIRWKNKNPHRKEIEWSEERWEKYSQQQTELKRPPRTRRKVNGEWIEN